MGNCCPRKKNNTKVTQDPNTQQNIFTNQFHINQSQDTNQPNTTDKVTPEPPPKIIHKQIQVKNKDIQPIQYIQYAIPGDDHIILYNIGSRKSKKIDITKKYEITDGHYSLIVGMKIYITGGQTNKTFLRSSIVYDIESGQVENIQKMIVPKSNHSAVALNDTFHYLAGGENIVGYIHFCEKYDVRLNRWKKVPNLQQKKYNISLVAVNHQYLYSFGGFGDNFTYYSTIERLDSEREEEHWRFIELDSNEGWSGRCEAGALQINDEAILIFGGMAGTPLAECFYFNIKERKMKKVPSLKNKDQFGGRNPIMTQNGEIYAISYRASDLHTFNPSINSWKIEFKRNWHPGYY